MLAECKHLNEPFEPMNTFWWVMRNRICQKKYDKILEHLTLEDSLNWLNKQ